MSDYITTYSKLHFDPVSPDPRLICPRDFAHALSQMARANGHFPEFYSVAQHCIFCAQEAQARGCSDREVLACLLHDASEAYLADITRPLKKRLRDYLAIEAVLQQAIYTKYLPGGLEEWEAKLVKEIDDALLYYEFLHYMGEELQPAPPPLASSPVFQQQEMSQVEEQYLQLFDSLTQRLELFDLVDEQGQPTGAVKSRAQVHAEGDWHRTVHIWIARKNAETSKIELLLQQRSPHKDSFPGCYDISSAGHIAAGDSYLPAALRELKEELGIEAAGEQLYLCFYHRGEWQGEFYGHPFCNREHSGVYLYLEPVNISELRLQPEEVSCVLWMEYETVLTKVRQGDPDFCIAVDELEGLGPYLEQYLG